jgi:hypothetical protein
MKHILIYDPIWIPDKKDGFKFIDPLDIIYIQGEDRYCNIYCINNLTYKSVSLSMKQIDEQLDKELFFRVHRSFFVSKRYMLSMNTKKSRITCFNKDVISIGIKHKADFLRQIKMEKLKPEEGENKEPDKGE